MAEVRAETPEDVHAVLMETADYWLSLGLAIGTEQPETATSLAPPHRDGGARAAWS